MKRLMAPNRRSALVILVMFVLCIPSHAFARAEEEFHESVELGRDGKVHVRNVSGDITIKGWKESTVQIEALKVARDRDDLDRVSIDVQRTNGTLRIMTEYHRRARNVSVHYDLYVPESASVRVNTVSGDAEAQSIAGHVSLESVSGDVAITKASGGVRGKTISGDVFLQDIVGDADLRSVSGGITVHGIQGSIEAGTVSGDVTLDKVSHAEEVVTESTSGRIRYQGNLSDRGNYEFSSHSGDVVIDLPSGSDFELQARTLSGKVKCDFELKISGTINPKKIQGVVGKGGANLQGTSFSGDIRINER